MVSLAPATDPKPVIAELDRLLEPYGSVGAVERRDQPSNRSRYRLSFSAFQPFLLNVALGRMVAAQREQIATLKALGFPTERLVMH